MHLGNVQATATGVYGSGYSCQVENSFSSTLKKSHISIDFSLQPQAKETVSVYPLSCFTAAVLNLVNQNVKLRSEWKLREKQPSDDRGLGQRRMMLLLE